MNDNNLDQRKEKYLYRYYSNERYILDVIANKHLYFCQPTEFNDPFDCRPLISIKYRESDDDDTWYKFLFYVAKHIYRNQYDSEIKKHADAAFAKNQHKDKLWLCNITEDLKKIEPLFRVCCFAKSPRNMMMWAHYASNHRGLVLQFRTSWLYHKTSNTFRGFDVNYAPSAVDVKDYVYAFDRIYKHDDDFELVRLFNCTKTSDWEKEEEVRFFSKKDDNYISFDEPALTKIIFGDNCEKKLIRKVMVELEKWQHKPRLFRTSILKSSHKLWISKYAIE